ncbi:hypothetical protein CRENPOLYSF2_500007 [Crenothrix polyspora]|uniref:Uncharacterized protein n=1 Tax=Crenothrix polyspora TaxID=360316 RepID=A0A1R4HGA6_9GAMM|nr:hypothetical protein [Crenothrix polyspora]SJM95247.1 hypothetical protein CRENPOLYSF2_500007 [Crenothrix polyspora]
MLLLKYQKHHHTIRPMSQHQLYLRTQSRELPSEKTVKQVLAASFVRQFFRVGQNTIIDEIRIYFLKVSDEIDQN